MPWLTPDAEGDTVYRLLRIPSGFLSQVNGALCALEYERSWEAYGSLTPAECAELMESMISAYFEENMSIGTMVPYATATIPDHLLDCDGSQYARADYPALYAALASAYIIDADTFVVPDMRNRVSAGISSTRSMGDTGGSDTVTLDTATLPPHNHTIQNAYGDDVVNGYLGAIGALVITQTEETTSTTGDGDPHENRQPTHYNGWGIVWR